MDDFDLKSGCVNVQLSFAAYEALEPYWNINTADKQRYIAHPNDTGFFQRFTTGKPAFRGDEGSKLLLPD